MKTFAWSRIQTALLIVLAIGCGLWWLQNNGEETPEQAPSGIPLVLVNDGVAYGYDKDGNNDLVLKSPEVRYYNDARGTHYRDPDLTQMVGVETNHIIADSAVQSQDNTLITMRGEVHGVHDDPNNPKAHTLFESDSVAYDLPKNTAETNDPVVITTPNSTSRAIGAIWLLNQNLFILKKKVRSNYAPPRNPQPSASH